MFADITPLVHRGIIDNTSRDTVELHLWCGLEETPVHLVLPGNCLRDIAGCRVEFQLKGNVSAAWEEAHEQVLAPLRLNTIPYLAGDITLSRRRLSLKHLGMMANYLYIEFFIGGKARYLIECETFTFKTSLPQWECSRAFENMQEMLNLSAMRDYVLGSAARFRGPGLSHAESELEPCKWDSILNRAEAFMSLLPYIADKYAGHPRSRLAEAFVMDREQLLDSLAAKEEATQSPLADAGSNIWVVMDFLDMEDAVQVRQAMEHPLFEATSKLSSTVQKYILAEPERYEGNKTVETLLTRYAGIISNVLATILLVQENPEEADKAMTRTKIISREVEKLKPLSQELHPKAQTKFIQGADLLIRELKTFFFTLR